MFLLLILGLVRLMKGYKGPAGLGQGPTRLELELEKIPTLIFFFEQSSRGGKIKIFLNNLNIL